MRFGKCWGGNIQRSGGRQPAQPRCSAASCFSLSKCVCCPPNSPRSACFARTARCAGRRATRRWLASLRARSAAPRRCTAPRTTSASTSRPARLPLFPCHAREGDRPRGRARAVPPGNAFHGLPLPCATCLLPSTESGAAPPPASPRARLISCELVRTTGPGARRARRVPGRAGATASPR